MITELFTCNRDGLTIKGKYYRPEGDSTFPAVIVSHGFNGNFGDMDANCRFFADEGYATFCFSFCGGSADGTPDKVRSDGSSLDMNLDTEKEDLIAVYNHACSLPFVDKSRVILYGESQGGFVSGLAAAKLGDRISKLIMIYPAICIPDHARRGILGGARYDASNPPEELKCPVTTLGKQMHEKSSKMDPFLELAPYKGPVLILHGMCDSVVDYRYSIRAQQEYGKDQCHLQLMAEADHGFNEAQKFSSFQSIKQFLAGHKEILSIKVIITRAVPGKDNSLSTNDVYFTGYCDNENFHGTVQGEGCDHQIQQPDGSWTLHANYTLKGQDSSGKLCTITVDNKKRNDEWKPTISTDSNALAFLESTDLTAVLEHSSLGPMVRIFA